MHIRKPVARIGDVETGSEGQTSSVDQTHRRLDLTVIGHGSEKRVEMSIAPPRIARFRK